jgi:HEAT repeat protein
MDELFTCKFDPRSTDDLINAALGELDEDKAWEAVVALHFRGTAEVLQRARALCESDCCQEQRLGADILGQLGVPNRSFPAECASILIRMLGNERDADVLQAIFVAVSHLDDDPRVSRGAAAYSEHHDPDVRHAVVLALTGYEDSIAVNCLIRLTTDSDSDVRDWATFGIGAQLKLDTPEIRAALMARLDDADDDTRGEAMIGLARRKDHRVLSAIERNLATNATEKAIEAAALFGSPSLLPSLLSLRESLDVSPSCLNDAINACRA